MALSCSPQRLHKPLCPLGSTVTHEDKSKGASPHRLSSFVTFGLLFSVLAVNSFCDSCFGTTRTFIVILSSVLFLPLVRPTRWLTKTAIKISLWSTYYSLSLLTYAFKPTFQIAISTAYTFNNCARRGILANWKSKNWRICVGLIISYFFVSNMPLLQVVTMWSRAIWFAYRLLRAYILMQYYMLLLASLELMIYLRVDCVMALISAPWFRWVIYRFWSILTWKDIALAFTPSAYYYVHLSLRKQ